MKEVTRDLSPAFEDYLKTIWSAHEWHDHPLTMTALATRMGHAPSTASEAVGKLTAQGLVRHPKYGSIDLTDTGRDAALAVVRRHRLLETFLVQHLGYGWDEVHDEAEVLEHAVSDKLVDRIALALGHPDRDPHGDPIPRRDGALQRPDAISLNHAPIGEPLVVARVADRSPDLLRYLEACAITLDASVLVTTRNESAGIVSVDIDGHAMDLGIPAARAIWVRALGSDLRPADSP